MPETDFYLCEADILEIGDLLFHQGARIVPDLRYPTSAVLEIWDLRKLQRVLDDPDSSLLFVVSPKWERSPLMTRSIEMEGRQVHYISQKEGGPTIDIFWHRPLEVNGVLAVPHGSISYYDCFWNPISGEMEPVPEGLINTYRVIRSQLARGGRKIIRTHRQLIVTKNTLASGMRLIDLKKNAREKTQFVPVNEGVPISDA